MKYYIMLTAAVVFMFMTMGCDNEKSSDTSSDTAVESVDTSAETTPADTGDSDTGDSDSGEVWDNPADELVEACGGNNSDIRLELLSEREIMRFRCIVGFTSLPDDVCEGYDPTLCLND